MTTHTKLQIKPLVYCKDRLSDVAGWYLTSFSMKDTTFDICKEKLLERLNTEILDICYVAFWGNKAAGTVSLTKNDIPGVPTLTPCIANLFVVPEYRHKNIGRELIEYAKAALKAMAFPKAYLYTTDKTIHKWYQTLSWKIIGEKAVYNLPIKIMECEL